MIARGPWLSLTWPTAVLVTVASAAGICWPPTYAKEAPSWAAQGIGQDAANLLFVVPALVISASMARHGSVRALLVWMGLVAYLLYSYVLYAFFVHFNALFLCYVATLGLSFYALLGVVLTIDRGAAVRTLVGNRRAAAMSVLLMVAGVVFAALWLFEISRALALGAAPASVDEVGLPVNPVHVLDLAFALPGLMLTAVLLRRRQVFGLLFAVPCAVFLATMGVAIIAMVLVQAGRGVSVPMVLPAAVGVTTAFSLFLTCSYLRELQPPVH